MTVAFPKPLSDRIEADRRRLTQRLLRAARCARDRSDPEATHDVRVATRQLEALLDVWRSDVRGPLRRRARRGLRRLRRDLGPARELRVFIGLMRGRMEALDAPAQVGVALLLDRWNRRLVRLDTRAARRCSAARIRRLRRRVDRALELVVEPVDASRLERAVERLERRRARAVERVRAAVANATDGGLHKARVAIKRWRYVLDRVAAAGHETERSTRDAFVSLQSSLGHIQDLATLRARLRRLRERFEDFGAIEGADALSRLAAILEQERLEAVELFRRRVLATSFSPAAILPLGSFDRRAGS